MLPFSREQFIGVFAHYNLSLWPLQMLVLGLGAVAVLCLARPTRWGDRCVGGLLAVLWVWTGVVYHAVFFTRINQAAWLFSALFVLQGAWLFHAAVLRGRLRFDRRNRARRLLGWTLVAYALVVYPLIGAWMGLRWPDMPSFGITPCPLTLLTLGALLLSKPPLTRGLFAIPLAWSVIGGSAAFLLDMPPDWMLPLGGLAVLPLLLRRRAGSPLALP